MLKYLPNLKIKRHFQYQGMAEDIYHDLQQMSREKWYNGKFSVKDMGNYEFQIEAQISYGTLSFMNGMMLPICCKMKIENPHIIKNNPRVYLSTDIRAEHFIFTAIVLFIGFIEGFDIILPIIGIGLALFLWFHWVYRLQENSLINKVISTFNLTEMKEDNMP